MADIIMPANMENFDRLMEFIQVEAKNAGFDNELVNKIRLACEEIIINVINYAYPDKEGDIEIKCDSDKEDNGFLIKITDWGAPFNPLSKSEPDINAPAEKREIGGLGIFLVRKVMDKFDYVRDGNSNILTLSKYF
jgi:anti-sigma regulatory factor (Ser/Thr protein kinase)